MRHVAVKILEGDDRKFDEVRKEIAVHKVCVCVCECVCVWRASNVSENMCKIVDAFLK